MSAVLEWKKEKRTGFRPAWIAGGLLAAAVPIVHMSFRGPLYTGQGRPPVEVLLDANWQVMAMVNLLLAVTGACMLYHTEQANRAIHKMQALPVSAHGLFFGKLACLGVMCLAALAMEFGSIAFCVVHWFPGQGSLAALKGLGAAFLLMLPPLLASLLTASCCENMWISLGIGVICIFAATMLPENTSWLSLFPYALPFQTCTERLARAAAVESAALALAALALPPVRRRFS